MFLAKMMTLLEPNSPKRVIGFDNFSGLPSPTSTDGDFATSQTGRYRGDYEVLMQAIDLFELRSKVELVVGDALETIPKYLEDHRDSVFSFCYLDFDLYEPTKKALEVIRPRLVKNAILVFDELVHSRYPGEARALIESSVFSSLEFEQDLNFMPYVGVARYRP